MQALYRFMDMSFAAKIAIFWLPLMFVAYDWYQNEYMALQLSNVQKRLQIKQKKAKIKETREFFSKNGSLEKQGVDLSSVKDVLAQIPQGRDLPKLIQDITNFANKTGVEIVNLNPKSEENLDMLAVDYIEVVVKGGFSQTLGFVGEISELARLVNISKMEMKRQGPSMFSQVKTDLVLSAYRMSAPHKGQSTN